MQDLVLKFIECQTLIMSPFIPHYAEHVWALLGHKESIMSAAWPVVPNADPVIIRMTTYFEKVNQCVCLQLLQCCAML